MEANMNQKTHHLLNDVNRAIIKFRGVYSVWSKKHGISYNEMLVLYTIRDNGYCTQKMICDSYLLPKQTINNVIIGMLKNGYLSDSPENSTGREKAYIFTDKGTKYAKPLLASINAVEEKAVAEMGYEKIRLMTELVREYDNVLNKALAEEEV